MSAKLTIELDDGVAATLDEVARRSGRAAGELAATAVADRMKSELDYILAIEEGLADIEAGRVYSHEQVMARMAERRSRREAASKG
jgi:predicted transcriptional regulator